MKPMEDNEYLVKMVTKSGQAITLISSLDSVTDLVKHPKFIKMRDTGNDIYISVEDITAFEIINNRVIESNEPPSASEAA